MTSGQMFDALSVCEGMSGPARIPWTPRLSITNVPVVITRLVWVRPGPVSRRVFCSTRDAALYLRLIFRVETITDKDVARCAEGCKDGAVFGTMHNARYATQVECNEFGPVCRVQKLEVVDESKRMSQFFKTSRSEFSTYREPRSPTATPSPQPDPFQFAVPRTSNAPRCPTPQNMMRPIPVAEGPPPCSPWAGVDLRQSPADDNPVVIQHVDGDRYILVPLPNYVAPSVKDRPRNHMHVDVEDNFTRLSDTSMSFPEAKLGGSGEAEGDAEKETEGYGDDDAGEAGRPSEMVQPCERMMKTNWMSDRDRTSYSSRGGDEATFILNRYKSRLLANLNTASGGREIFATGFPTNAEIIRMAETNPACSIFPSGAGTQVHFDSYIAVCLAIISINTKYSCEQIIESIVRATEGVAKRGEKALKSREDYVRKAFRSFVKQNRPSRNINSVTPELIRQNKRGEKKDACWAYIRRSGVYRDLCVLKAATDAHLGRRRRLTGGTVPVNTNIPDLKFPDPLNGGTLVSFRDIVCEQLDRVEDECEMQNSWKRAATEYKVVCKSAINRLALNINTEELKGITGSLVYPKPAKEDRAF